MRSLGGTLWSYRTSVLIRKERDTKFLPNYLLCVCMSLTLEKAMAAHSSTLAWKIPWMEEAGRLRSIGSQRVGHDWVTKLSLSYAKWVQFSLSVKSDSWPPHGLQHARFPCPSPTPRDCSNSCPLSRWCHPTISSSGVAFSSRLQFFQHIRVFSNESVLFIRWPNYWSISFI